MSTSVGKWAAGRRQGGRWHLVVKSEPNVAEVTGACGSRFVQSYIWPYPGEIPSDACSICRQKVGQDIPSGKMMENPLLYHGTTGGPDRPEPPRTGGGLLGDGYYLASTEEAAAAWTKRRMSYGEREPVVRVIDVPDMKLFDLNAKLTPETVKRLAATKQGSLLREDMAEEISRRDDAPTNGTLYRVFGKDWSNSVLAEAGYEGVIQHHKAGYAVPATNRGWQWQTIGAWDEVMIFPHAMGRLKTASWKRVFNPSRRIQNPEAWEQRREDYEGKGRYLNTQWAWDAVGTKFSPSGYLYPPVDVWYHGTSRDFARFDRKVLRGAGVNFNSVLGFHFSSVRDVANEFGQRGRVIPARLRIAHPKVYRTESELEDDAFQFAVGKGIVTRGMVEATLNRYRREPREYGFEVLSDYLATGKYSPELAFILMDVFSHKWDEIGSRFVAHLRAKGYDGIVYGNVVEHPKGHPSAIVFSPSQIEPAVGRQPHMKVVQKALREGKPVPAPVLAEYPGLQANPCPSCRCVVKYRHTERLVKCPSCGSMLGIRR